MSGRIGAICLPVNRLHMELTNICNFSCEFCPDQSMKRPRGMMPIETAKSIIDEVAETGVARLLLFHVMGEPTLHPGLVDIVAYAREKHVPTCLTTNGSRLDDRLFRDLCRAGVGEIIISLQTPDERTFSLRSARGISFEDYAERVASVARAALSMEGRTRLTISFLSSPLRRLIIPIFPDVSIADTTPELKRYLGLWAERVLAGTPYGSRRGDVLRQIRKIWTFKENTIIISGNLAFHTRVMGDWSVHFGRKNVDARFGYCPAVRDNFGILWNGDYTFCCTDYDGKTTTHNYNDTPIHGYLGSETVQRAAREFGRFKVWHPHCRQCLGEKNLLNAVVKQIGSILYFKVLRRDRDKRRVI